MSRSKKSLVDLFIAEETPEDATVTLLQDPKASKASKIRALFADEFPEGRIAKMLNIRYQHVYNTIHTDGKEYPEGTAFCKVCGRPLVDSVSVQNGIGPVCDGRSTSHKKPGTVTTPTADEPESTVVEILTDNDEGDPEEVFQDWQELAEPTEAELELIGS